MPATFKFKQTGGKGRDESKRSILTPKPGRKMDWPGPNHLPRGKPSALQNAQLKNGSQRAQRTLSGGLCRAEDPPGNQQNRCDQETVTASPVQLKDSQSLCNAPKTSEEISLQRKGHNAMQFTLVPVCSFLQGRYTHLFNPTSDRIE